MPLGQDQSEMRETDVKMPFLDLIFGDNFRVTLPVREQGVRKVDGPPFVESMTIKRRVSSFSASEWNIEIYDSTAEVFEKLLAAMYISNTGPKGRLSYSFGWTDQSGNKVSFPTIHGLIRLVSPRYLREATRISIDGIDFGAEDAVARVSSAAVLSPSESWNVRQWIENVFEATGISVEVEQVPEGFLEDIMLSGFVDYLTQSIETNNASSILYRVASRHGRGSISEISLKDFFGVVDEVLSVVADMEVSYRFDGMNENGVQKLTVIPKANSPVPIMTYVVNSQKKEKDTDFIRVSNFSPNLDPLGAGIFVPREMDVNITDRLTRQSEIAHFSYDDAGGVLIGSGLLTSSSSKTNAPFVMPSGGVRFRSAESSGRSRELLELAERLDDLDLQTATLVARNIHKVFHNFPINASMTVEFPPVELQPYAHINVKVMTNKGVCPISSGRYLVQDIVYYYRWGSLQATASLLKSGGRSLPGTDKEKVPSLSTIVSDETEEGS